MAVLLCAAWAVSCNKPQESKEAVRQAVIDHIQKNSGIDPAAMDIQVTTVSFAKDTARATVSFQPKNQPGAGLSMDYTLENKDGKWAVKGRGQSPGGGSGHGGAMGGQMPGGMPGAQPGGGAMPPGHPPVQEGGAKPNPPSDSGKK
jgi:hypothetical protein